MRQLSPRAELAFTALWTAFSGFIWIGFAIGNLAGGNATATVVHVYAQDAYTIRFTTKDGTECVTPHKWDTSAQPIELNDTFEIHYSQMSSCDNVERADDWFSRYGFILIPTLLLVAGSFKLNSLLRDQRPTRPAPLPEQLAVNPQPGSGRPRSASMPPWAYDAGKRNRQ